MTYRLCTPPRYIHARLLAVAMAEDRPAKVDCYDLRSVTTPTLIGLRPRDHMAVAVAHIAIKRGEPTVRVLARLAKDYRSFWTDVPPSSVDDLRRVMRHIDTAVPDFVAAKSIARSALLMHLASRKRWFDDVDEGSVVWTDSVRDLVVEVPGRLSKINHAVSLVVAPRNRTQGEAAAAASQAMSKVSGGLYAA
jgi:hypothetical protein